MKIHSAILAALGAATVAAPALATTVSYADLDLKTAQGQTQLNRRINTAAREICGINDIQTGTRVQDARNKQCFEAAKASARKQIAERVSRDGARGG